MSYRTLNAKKALLLTTIAVLVLAAFGLSWNSHLNQPPVARDIPAVNSPSPNAADTFLGAAAEIVRKDDVTRALATVPAKKDHILSPAEKGAVVADNARALQIVRLALRQPFMARPMRSYEQPLPELSNYRGVARLLALQGQVRQTNGDYAGAADSSLDAVALGVAMPHGGVLIQMLSGIACVAIGERRLFERVDHLTGDQAAADARRLQGLADQTVPYCDTLRQEKYLGESVLVSELRHRSVYGTYHKLVDDVGTDSSDDADQPKHETFAQYVSLHRISRQQAVDDYVRTSNAVIAEMNLPYSPHRQAVKPSGDPLADLLISIQIDAECELKWRACMMDTNLLTAALALHAFRARTGAYPASLNDLVRSRILQHVPPDPFAATDAPLRYKPEPGDRFLLYSVGPDGVDDMGKPVALRAGNAGKYQAPAVNDSGDWVYGVNTPRN